MTKTASLIFCFLGMGTFLVSFGFLYFGLQTLAAHKQLLYGSSEDSRLHVSKAPEKFRSATLEPPSAPTKTQPQLILTPRIKFLVAVFSAFLFFYVGIEYCVGMYLATFAVQSDLNVSVT